MSVILKGDGFPDPSYAYRVSLEKYVNAIHFLNGRLTCKLSYTTSIRVGNQVLENVPVLNREQYLLSGLFDQ